MVQVLSRKAAFRKSIRVRAAERVRKGPKYSEPSSSTIRVESSRGKPSRVSLTCGYSGRSAIENEYRPPLCICRVLEGVQHRENRVERVGVLDLFVIPPAEYSREPYSHTRLVPRRTLQRLERYLEHKPRLHRPDRPECLDRVVANVPVHFAYLGIGQARISFCERHEVLVFPDGKRVIGEQIRPLPGSLLGVDQNCVDRQRVDLPFPPVAAVTAYAVRRI